MLFALISKIYMRLAEYLTMPEFFSETVQLILIAYKLSFASLISRNLISFGTFK